jgi:hypothetical protein
MPSVRLVEHPGTWIGSDYSSPETPAASTRGELRSDEGPLIGEVAAEPWAEAASEIAAWVLRCSQRLTLGESFVGLQRRDLNTRTLPRQRLIRSIASNV